MKKSNYSEQAGLSGERDTDTLFLESCIMAYLKNDRRKGIDIMNWINILSFWEENIDEKGLAELLKDLTASGLISPGDETSDVLNCTYTTTDKGNKRLEKNIPFFYIKGSYPIRISRNKL